MIEENLNNIRKELPPEVKLVAVSKFHPLENILEAYRAGQRVFAESRPQELQKKVEQLRGLEQGGDISWHFIGHLQTNKLKMVLPYVDMVQSVDSLNLLSQIDSWARKNPLPDGRPRKIRVLLELHIASEQTKQGFVEEEILDILFRHELFKGVEFCGLMGMATNTDNEEDISSDFARISSFMEYLRDLFSELEEFRELSIGMSDDWKIALRYGATMVRIGSAIFGPRQP